MVETESARPAVPEVQDKRSKIPGLLPKNAQTRVLGGIALLMVVIICLAGKNPPKERPSSTQAPPADPVNPNQARIQEYRAAIEEQTRRLADEEARLAHTQQALGVAPGGQSAGASAPSGLSRPYTAVAPAGYPAGWQETTPPSALQAEKEKREYQAHFASNIALSYRAPMPLEPAEKVTRTAESAAKTNPPERRTGDLKAASGKEYRIFEGTLIETVLTNRLLSNLSGPVNCLVTTNLYSHDGQHVLIPQGTRVLGEVRKVESFGEARLAVTFHRLIMPDGFSVSLDKFQGLNQQGETGLLDQVNHHYLQVFGVSIAIGAIAGLAQANTQYGAQAAATDAYRQGVASSLSQSSLHILDRYLNVLPTYTIREGHRVKVYLSEDLLLPAYDQHQIPGDI
jgi:type IV secretory pathway VirB10-like protein